MFKIQILKSAIQNYLNHVLHQTQNEAPFLLSISQFGQMMLPLAVYLGIFTVLWVNQCELFILSTRGFICCASAVIPCPVAIRYASSASNNASSGLCIFS